MQFENPPLRQIRAVYGPDTIRVYQAYSDAIADSALRHGTFVSPPFKMQRMTWIKPSFLWMMYRAGWGYKDSGQARILAIDISRQGFEWALTNSCLSHYDNEQYASEDEWRKVKDRSPVRIQWDPERNLRLNPLTYRAIQIGLKEAAVTAYVGEWIKHIEDVTALAHTIESLVMQGELETAAGLLPAERPYPVPDEVKKHIGVSGP